jgi:tRNA(Leu) C34 or U34 (ribose-2'-O)-methylase TrmL
MAYNKKETNATHFYGVGLHHARNGFNIGAVLRAAGAFGASFLAISGQRYKDFKSDYRCTDSDLARKQIPVYMGVDSLQPFVPVETQVVVIERLQDATALDEFEHPRRAFYVFGPEDGAVPSDLFPDAPRVYVKSQASLNLGMCANIVMHDRFTRLQTQVAPELVCPDCGSDFIKDALNPPVEEDHKWMQCCACGSMGPITKYEQR